MSLTTAQLTAPAHPCNPGAGGLAGYRLAPVEKKRLWIDTDINPPPTRGSVGTFFGANVDDAVALLAAVAHPAVELVGVSTVGSDPERRAAVAVGLLAGAGVDLGLVAVWAGAAGAGGPEADGGEADGRRLA